MAVRFLDLGHAPLLQPKEAAFAFCKNRMGDTLPGDVHFNPCAAANGCEMRVFGAVAPTASAKVQVARNRRHRPPP